MTTARKYQLAHRSKPVPEIASEVREGLDNLADATRTLGRAFCCLAVKQEARNPAEQRELAAIMWADCVGDFRDVPVTEEMRNWMASLLNIDPKAFPKRPYGR